LSEIDLFAELAALRERFLRNAASRLEELARALDAVARDASNAAALERFIHVAHNLAGLGGTYGFPRVSEISRTLVNEARAIAGSPPEISTKVRSWREAYAELAEELTTGAAASSSAEPPSAPSAPRTVVLCAMREVPAGLASEVIEVRHVPSLELAKAQLKESLPDVLLADWNRGGNELVQELRGVPGGDDVLALVVGVASGDAMRKVEVLRSGADSFLAECAPDAIVKRLSVLLDQRRAAAPRILSVEDDPDQAELLTTVLSSAGYSVRVCDDPAMFESDLQSFRPDLILMDVDLPGVRGDELASSVRQSDELATLPIVFLTANEQPLTRLRTAKAGGDDFLVKPVSPPLLIATVAARIERSRHLAALFERDGVTGLLTHAVFFDKLHALWNTPERRASDAGVALAIIDLDHFKRVNDTYGHLTGDRVLASFGSLARRRLRSLDVVGRYGGEEFALVVTGVNANEAAALADRLREEFAAVEQHATDGAPFHTTFSAGVAPLNDAYDSVEEWIAAADAALYRAKAHGRNQVATAN